MWNGLGTMTPPTNVKILKDWNGDIFAEADCPNCKAKHTVANPQFFGYAPLNCRFCEYNETHNLSKLNYDREGEK